MMVQFEHRCIKPLYRCYDFQIFEYQFHNRTTKSNRPIITLDTLDTPFWLADLVSYMYEYESNAGKFYHREARCTFNILSLFVLRLHIFNVEILLVIHFSCWLLYNKADCCKIWALLVLVFIYLCFFDIQITSDILWEVQVYVYVLHCTG